MEAKAISMSEVIDRLGIAGLRRNGWELSGPCPICGASGHDPKSGPVDRFNINLRTNQWLCRKCPDGGGDQISLVQFVEQCSFPEALTILRGDKPKEETEEQRRARQKRQDAAKQKVERQAREQEQQSAKFRRKAIANARSLWANARDGNLGVVPTYLKARGITPEALPRIPMALRFVSKLPYLVKINGRYEAIHTGPAMVAEILNRRNQLTAVHRTWIDPNPPHGKAKIWHDGEAKVSKKVLGSKQGGAIRLHTPEGADTLVMGEGIETTLTAMVADPFPNAAYWAGVDLGNMSGRMQKMKGQRYSGLPDMSDSDAFVPPSWVKRLVFIMDGDSDPKMTRAKLECGLRRAMALHPGLEGKIVHAGKGVDLNDVLMGASPDDEGGDDV
ncbi:DUF7146 domain-containing protein [Thalassovita sp.]|uniref:DUF7146 domain-containing protein n=1 Tax=Thalassovita sp. TaxID=1979401 RepID=UPI003B5BCD46